MFSFQVVKSLGLARFGRLQTPRGVIETPAFVPCATKAVVRCLTPEQLLSTGVQCVLANTYHLMVNRGSQIMREHGGIHRFMGWEKPVFTDSGGFQVFSLGERENRPAEIKSTACLRKTKSLVRISEEGVTFRSHIDGSQHLLTPERSIQVQRDIGSDIALVLDECTAFGNSRKYTEDSLALTHRWEERSLQAFQATDDGKQVLYGIVQGGIYRDLREKSVDFVNQRDFFGYAIGGTLGENREQMYAVVEYCLGLDPQKPRHLLGIGSIQEIFYCANLGIDTFDCVHPTRIARHGAAIVRYSSTRESVKEHINLRNKRFEHDRRALDPRCFCYTCRHFSRAYLHYLLRARESTVHILLTLHNLAQMQALLAEIRDVIQMGGSLALLQAEWLPPEVVQDSVLA